MSNLFVKDGNGNDKFIKSVGAGTDLDPQINHFVICDVNGNPVDVDKGSLNIHSVDVHDIPINQYAHKLSGISATLATAASVGDTSITLSSSVGFNTGDVIVLNGDESFAVITVIAANLLTLDRSLDKALAGGVDISVADIGLNDVGTLASPLLFKIEPPAGEVWHVMRILLIMTHPVAGDLSKFGGIAALTNGVQLVSTVNGIKHNISNWKNNCDIKNDVFDLEFTDRAGGAGTFGTSARYTFSKLGVAVKLNGDTNDSLDILIQDDISSLTTFTLKGQGHIAE